MVLTFRHPTVILEEKIYKMNNTMKTETLTFREALVILEEQYDSTYRPVLKLYAKCVQI